MGVKFTSRKKAIFLFAIAFSIFISGCIVIPVPLDKEEAQEGRIVAEEQLTLLQKGSTTKEGVLERLGPPSFIWKAKNLFAYFWIQRWGHLFIAAFVPPFGGGMGVDPVDIQYALFFQFDECDRIREFEKIKIDLKQEYRALMEDWARKTDSTRPP